VTFSGTFERIDGTRIVLPLDRMGHLSLMVFWSKNKPGLESYLDMMKAEQAKFPGLIDVFSFNVDELADGGESVLREKGLDWTVMKLAAGRRHQAYRSYAQGDPVAILVNEYGLSVTRPEIVHGRTSSLEPMRISEERYMAQLQSLFIGDFLVAGAEDGGVDRVGPATGEVARAIQECFPAAPFRYRLTGEQALANYRQAAELCAGVMEQNPQAPDLYELRNKRIIALLGMWNLACAPRHLADAVKEAKTALAAKLPPGADVVPRFCLAKAVMRRDVERAESVVTGLAEDGSGARATASALAAAAILALDARSRELHEAYRSRFLAEHAGHPRFYAFTSFLRDRHHRYRLLRPNYSRRERGSRGYIVNHGWEPMTNRLPRIVLKTLDGNTRSLPPKRNGRLTLLVFLEPPAEPGADFPASLDSRGRPTRHDTVRQVMDFAQKLSDEHVNKGVDTVAAFLCEDADRVDWLMKTNGWHGQAAMVPGGLENPMVRQLGVLSADRLPNIFLLRRDGTIAWRGGGYLYKTEFGFPFAFHLGMKVHIELCEVEHAYKALERGHFEEAARVFAGPYLPWRPDRFGWRAPRHHGRALACMGLEDWATALEAIECAIDAHKLRHFHGRESKNIADWRKNAATVTMKVPCDVISELWATKAVILGKLGREEEAAAVRKRSEEPVEPDHQSLYGLFHERLKKVRLRGER